jgi:hypothetical protein
LLKFVSVKQTNHINDKYDAQLKTLTEQIETKTKERDAIKPPKAPRERRDSQKREKRQRRNSQDSGKSENLEDRLQDILKEVSKRSDSVRFSKDDFESFSEAQTQLDALLSETVTEIFRMKQRLRKRFATAQSRSSSRRRQARPNRRRN